MEENEQLFSRKQAAAYLQRRGCSISYSSLANLGAKENAGKGPSYYKDGGRTVYTQTDLEQWRRGRLRRVE